MLLITICCSAYILISVLFSGCNCMVALIGTKTHLNCSVSDSRQPHSIIWTKDGSQFSPPTFNNKLHFSYEIRNVTYQDGGEYVCHIFYESGPFNTQRIFLQILGYPKYLSNISASVENDTLFANCCVKYSPESPGPKLTWLIGNEEFIPTKNYTTKTSLDPAISVVCDAITFRSSRQFHKKRLLCLTGNRFGSNSTEMNVTYSSTVKLLEVKAAPDDSPDEIWENENVTIECKADGNPSPDVTLERNAVGQFNWEMLPDDSVTRFSTNNKDIWVFVLLNVRRNTSGFYRCAAINHIGLDAVSQSVYLDIKYTTSVLMIASQTLQVEWGGNYTIICETVSNPMPQVTVQTTLHGYWVEIPTKSENILTKGHLQRWKFHFRNVSDKFNGKYRCVASNKPETFAISDVISVSVMQKALPHGIATKQVQSIIISVFAIFVLAILLFTWFYFHRKRTSLYMTVTQPRADSSRCQQTIIRNSRMITTCQRSTIPDVITNSSCVSEQPMCYSSQTSLPYYTENKGERGVPHQPMKDRWDDLHCMTQISRSSNSSDLTCNTSEGTLKGKRRKNCDSNGYSYVWDLEFKTDQCNHGSDIDSD